MSDTPETDAAIKASNGQWSFVLKENCERMERERDQARRELDIQLESIKFHMERVPVKDHPLRADDAPLQDGGAEPRPLREGEPSDFCGAIRRMRDALRERDEAREALRVLFEDYKQLADSGGAGFWELEDKEAAQPALRILQQMDATNQTTKHEQVSSKLARYKKGAEVVTDKQEVFRRLVEAIVTTDMTADTLLEIRRLFGDEIDAAVACLRRTDK